MRSIMLAVSLMLVSTYAFALESPTENDAESLVKQAVAYSKEHGTEKLLNEVKNPNGNFHFQEGTKKGLYIIVYDEKGVVVAQGAKPGLDMVKQQWNDKDPAGIRNWTDLTHKSGNGWLLIEDYNPANNKIMKKLSYVELTDGVVVGCGIYQE